MAFMNDAVSADVVELYELSKTATLRVAFNGFLTSAALPGRGYAARPRPLASATTSALVPVRELLARAAVFSRPVAGLIFCPCKKLFERERRPVLAIGPGDGDGCALLETLLE